MNKDKRADLESLRLKHFDLLQELDEAKDHPAPLVPRIKEQIGEWRQAGEYISEAGERDYLRSILSFWGSFVFEHSEPKEYPETNLYPLDIRIAQRAKIEGILKRVVWPVTAITAVLMVLGIGGYVIIRGVGPSVTPAAAGEGGLSDSATHNVQVEPVINNQLPTAVISGPTSGMVGETLIFSGAGSSDDGNIVRYAWDFGDGTTGSGVSVTHVYNAAGSYKVTLTVTDDAGLSVTVPLHTIHPEQ